MLHRWLLCLTVPLFLLTACIPEPLDLALSGKLPEDESNTVITEYCHSCHIHRTFAAADHAPRMQLLYDREPFNAAVQCRTCHLVGENTWGMKSRKTIFPADADAGRFTASDGAPSRTGLLGKISEFLSPASAGGESPPAGGQDVAE